MKHDIYLPSDPKLKPGEARCPGPTVQELLARDNDGLPPVMRTERYEFMGDADVPFSRYTSKEFYQREIDKLWTKVWQWACREEQIPAAGDYYVYDIAHYSVLVIRGSDLKVRAFVNSCPHRGMAFCNPGEMGKGKQFLRCPFHGMSWELDGRLREIPCRWDFPHIKDELFGLTELPCDSWGGFVFINLDRNAPPLSRYLEVLPEHFASIHLENRFITLHTQKLLPGNWKMCMEGFLEAYHVLATHPEGLRNSSWANTQYDLYSPHVTRFYQPLASGNPQFEREVPESELFAAMGHDKNQFREGVSSRQQHADILRKRMGAEMQVDLSKVSNGIMLDSIEYHLFPNACFFPGISIPLIYRFRPVGVDQCIHDIMMLQPLPSDAPRPPPAKTHKLGIDDSYTEYPPFGRLGAVLDQDTDNFKRQWAGMMTSMKTGQTLGNYQEARIRHFHQVLDRYLA